MRTRLLRNGTLVTAAYLLSRSSKDVVGRAGAASISGEDLGWLRDWAIVLLVPGVLPKGPAVCLLWDTARGLGLHASQSLVKDCSCDKKGCHSQPPGLAIGLLRSTSCQ